MFGSANSTATVSFVDIAGIVRGASEGQGLGNKFLAHIREADAICQVIRVFDDPDVVHVDGKVSPVVSIETINTELVLADLQTVDKALPRLQKEARIKKERQPAYLAAEAAREILDGGRTCSRPVSTRLKCGNSRCSPTSRSFMCSTSTAPPSAMTP